MKGMGHVRVPPVCAHSACARCGHVVHGEIFFLTDTVHALS